MLILTRKQGESVVIGNSVRVTVLDSSAGGVRLGFEAPAEVSIYRDEVFREIAEANRLAFDESGAGGGGQGATAAGAGRRR